MNYRIKNIAGYKKQILDLIPDMDNKSKAEELLDAFALDIIEVGLMNVSDYAGVIGKYLMESTNHKVKLFIEHMEKDDDRGKSKVADLNA